MRAHFGSAMLRTGGLKGFADGSLGSTTALFFDPYLEAAGNCPVSAIRVVGADGDLYP